uniref:Adenylate cyclase n=1 Tax=Opuntia streptacantha TaxID=393608 RepID=A0A7C9CX19_OPUST
MLKTLVLGRCGELDLSLTEDMEAGMPWKALKNLQYLTFDWIPKLVNLPDGLQHVTNLRCLCLESNINLVALPEWISCFSSLVQMEIHNCPKLSSFPERFGELTSLHQLEIIANKEFIKRCQSPDGEDWPKIKHIPFLIIKEAL